ncbi:MAG TPA: hypothetical protein VKV35_07165 [Streptosporangiaceae bacterium]|jgi:hypothetical protein|nr:hypothetical protein [Streptosporangiaceae bacterium]
MAQLSNACEYLLGRRLAEVPPGVPGTLPGRGGPAAAAAAVPAAAVPAAPAEAAG